MSDPREEEKSLLFKLSNKELKIRFKRALLVIKKVGQYQLTLLKAHEKANKENLHAGFLYFINVLDEFWDNVDFVLALGKGKNRHFAHYPTRTILETTFRIEYYINQKTEGQNRISDLEVLRIMKKMYDDERSKGGTGDRARKDYEGLLRGSQMKNKEEIQDISKVSLKKLDPFPELWELIRDTKLKRGDMNWYFHYQILCEYSHSKMVAIMMQNADELRKYRTMLAYVEFLAADMIKLVDHHIQGRTKDLVFDAIKRADAIMQAPV